MRVGSGVILFQLAGFLTSALADFYFAKHSRGFDLRKEFTSVNSSSGPELTRKRLVRELRRSFVFEKNHPAKDEDFSRTLNIC